MSFDQKLTTLMNLYKISNVQLARSINVDTSIISRWKNGDRKIPVNSPHIPEIARFFLGLEALDYQIEYLDQIIYSQLPEKKPLDDNEKIRVLADWLVSIQSRNPKIAEQPLFDKSPVGISINRYAQILYVNQAYIKMFGYSDSKELHGTPFINAIAPGCREKFADQLHLREQEIVGSGAYESIGIRKNGSLFPIYVEINNITLPDGPANVSFVSDITQRKHYEDKLKHQVNFQKILLEISQAFTNIAQNKLDELINDTLQKIGVFNEDDRSYVFLYSNDETTVSNTHEWCAEGITSERVNLQSVSVLKLPWWHESIQRLEYVFIPKVSDLPDSFTSGKDLLESQGIRSLVVVPMISEDKAIGFLGFDSVKKIKTWSEETIMLLQFAAQVITNGIVQKKYFLALRESENYYRTIFNAGDPKLIIEENYAINIANAEFLKMTGYTQAELVNTKLLDFLCQDGAEKLNDKIHANSMLLKHLSKIANQQGKSREVLISTEMIPGTRKYLVTLADYSEYFRINRALETTRACHMAIIQATNEEELINLICQRIIESGGYKLAWLGYLDEDDRDTLHPVAAAGCDKDYMDHLRIALSDPTQRCQPARLAIQAGQNIVCKEKFMSSIAIPLSIVGNDPIGSLNIYSEESEVFDEDEVKLLSDMGLDLTYGILSIRTQNRQKKTARQLEASLAKARRNLNQTVTSLATFLEIRDPYTAGHQRKVTELATTIAGELGLSEDQIEGIFVAATLHDIGKINVPNEILSKPGILTDIEFGLIKTHCKAGYDIVKEIEFPWPIADIIYQHHERMDGSGYPNSLSGQEILIESRIIAVADVVEAMASHRPYRPALELQLAFEEISRVNSCKYDQNVVEACLNLFNNKGFKLT